MQWPKKYSTKSILHLHTQNWQHMERKIDRLNSFSVQAAIIGCQSDDEEFLLHTYKQCIFSFNLCELGECLVSTHLPLSTRRNFNQYYASCRPDQEKILNFASCNVHRRRSVTVASNQWRFVAADGQRAATSFVHRVNTSTQSIWIDSTLPAIRLHSRHDPTRGNKKLVSIFYLIYNSVFGPR